MRAKKQLRAEELGIDVKSGRERELFKWFLASFLFGKRIQQDIAAKAYRVLVDKHGLDTPHKISQCTWQQLVDMLGEAHFVRYDESTATRLLELSKKLEADHGGKLGRLRETSRNRRDCEARLGEFKGVGPKTIEIFMREAAQVWFG